jgi:hypothetical protein
MGPLSFTLAISYISDLLALLANLLANLLALFANMSRQSRLEEM